MGLPGPGGKLIHASVRIGDSELRHVDENLEWGALGPKSLKGSPVTIHHYVENVDATVKQGVGAGATITMALANMFWENRYDALEDPFGHHWFVATHTRDVSPQEMQGAMGKASSAEGANRDLDRKTRVVGEFEKRGIFGHRRVAYTSKRHKEPDLAVRPNSYLWLLDQSSNLGSTD
jgi:PhnB protein